MNVTRMCGTIVICFLCFNRGQCFIPFAPLVGGVLGVITESICRFKECCTDDYIPGDLNLLNSLLETELHHQHLAVETVQNALKDYMNATRKEALAMSFHGSSGTGKNLMVNLIVDALYKEGAKSNYVHHYNGHLDFYSKEKVVQYQHHIQDEITKHLGSCARSIFIFNEVDHMPDGILDALMPFLDYNPRVLSVDPTKAMFIFVSNTGSDSIERQLIKMWQAGKKREETKLEDLKPLLVNSAFDGQGGFHRTDVIHMNLIDFYIPFLPFEEIHVRKCVDSVLKNNDFELTRDSELTEIIDEVMTHITFGPSPYNIYSESGCKRVDSKVFTVVERNRLKNPSV